MLQDFGPNLFGFGATVHVERMQAEGIRRLGQPGDTAALVAFLCGDEARHIHGAGISVDGGATKGYF